MIADGLARRPDDAMTDSSRSDRDEASVEALRDAIRHLHGCDSRWVESTHVHEKLGDATVWEGSVQVFDLVDHPQAKRAYAWSYEAEGGKRKFLAVLGMGPVVDARTAVQASTVASERKKRN
jgi:hypothetical protein